MHRASRPVGMRSACPYCREDGQVPRNSEVLNSLHLLFPGKNNFRIVLYFILIVVVEIFSFDVTTFQLASFHTFA